MMKNKGMKMCGKCVIFAPESCFRTCFHTVMKKLLIRISVFLLVVVVILGVYRCNAASVNESDLNLASLARHGEDVSILVDFGISSSRPRFFVYDNKSRSLISSSKCAHGSGGGSTSSKPVFSNEIGSNCSSLGEFKLTENSRMNWINWSCIRLRGLSKTNSNAAARGVVIHEAPFVADDISIGLPIPINKNISQGCFSISKKTFKLLQSLMQQNKSIYLYAVCREH